jgi:hypothetical protein
MERIDEDLDDLYLQAIHLSDKVLERIRHRSDTAADMCRLLIHRAKQYLDHESVWDYCHDVQIKKLVVTELQLARVELWSSRLRAVLQRIRRLRQMRELREQLIQTAYDKLDRDLIEFDSCDMFMTK